MPDAPPSPINLPNALSTLRLAAVPGMVWLLQSQRWEWAFWLFLAAALTDALDGFLARRWNQTTALGAALDTVADKGLGLVTLVMLTQAEAIPLWVTLAILSRDSVVVLGALTYRGMIGPLVIHPTWLGKTYTAVEFTMLTVALATFAGHVTLEPLEVALFGLSFVLAVGSGVQYVWIWSGKARAGLRADDPD